MQQQAQTDQQPKPRIGFLGMGSMGSRMATRLIDAGYPVTVFNRTLERAEQLARRGARIAQSPADLGEHVDLILSSLSNDDVVKEVLLGATGALQNARSGITLIDLSTVAPGTSRELARAASEKRISVLDAPVSGSTPQAEQGTLVMFIGGDESVFHEFRGVLEVLAHQIHYMGPNGMGSMMKLVVNTLLGVEMQAIAEAIALGEKGGIEKQRLLDVLGQTTVIAPAHHAKLQNASRDTYPAMFGLRLMEKDFGLILRLAEHLGVPMPITAAAWQMCTAEVADEERRGSHDEDFSVVIRLMEQLAGEHSGGVSAVQ